jgi:hypothetical protein
MMSLLMSNQNNELGGNKGQKGQNCPPIDANKSLPPGAWLESYTVRGHGPYWRWRWRGPDGRKHSRYIGKERPGV